MSMLGTQTANTSQDNFKRRFFRALILGARLKAALSFVVGPYLLICLISWVDRGGSFWGPEFSFFQDVVLWVLFLLGGRLWDLQQRANETQEQTKGIAEKLGELQQALDLKLGAVQGSLGDRVLQIKGISLDITEQLSAVERKIDAITRRA